MQGNFNWNTIIFIEEKAIGNVICKMVAISVRPQSVLQLVITGSGNGLVL